MERRNQRCHKNHVQKCLTAALLLSAVVLFTSFTAGSFEEDYPSVVSETMTPAVVSLYSPQQDVKVVTALHKEEVASSMPEPEPNPWTKDEVIALAKMLYGEARGVPSKQEQAGCVWCVLNRCDEYNKGIIEIVTAPNQFVGYNPDHPVLDELYDLCEDVLARWYAEKDGEQNVGRVIPPDYLYFHGDGKQNYFRNEFKGGTTWDWSYPNPYET